MPTRSPGNHDGTLDYNEYQETHPEPTGPGTVGSIERAISPFWTSRRPTAPTRIPISEAQIRAGGRPGVFLQALQEEIRTAQQDMQRQLNQELFFDWVGTLPPPVSAARHVTPEVDPMNDPSLSAKRVRKILLKYPFALEHRGRSYRMSYHNSKRRWRLQEWENKTCKIVREDFVRGQAACQNLRETWMKDRTAALEATT